MVSKGAIRAATKIDILGECSTIWAEKMEKMEAVSKAPHKQTGTNGWKGRMASGLDGSGVRRAGGRAPGREREGTVSHAFNAV